MLTGSTDRSILATDVETGATIARLEDSHEDAIYSLINVTESTVASGDDQGCIKVWDTRQRTLCNSFDAHKEYVSDMTFAADAMKLLGTSFWATVHGSTATKSKGYTGTASASALASTWRFICYTRCIPHFHCYCLTGKFSLIS